MPDPPSQEIEGAGEATESPAPVSVRRLTYSDLPAVLAIELAVEADRLGASV